MRRRDVEFRMPRAEMFGDAAGELRLVPAPPREADRETANRIGRALRHDRGDEAGVDPTGEEGTNRNVRRHSACDGIAKQGVEFLDTGRSTGALIFETREGDIAKPPIRHRFRCPPAHHAGLIETQKMPAPQLRHTGEDRLPAQYITKLQI